MRIAKRTSAKDFPDQHDYSASHQAGPKKDRDHGVSNVHLLCVDVQTQQATNAQKMSAENSTVDLPPACPLNLLSGDAVIVVDAASVPRA